jgi:hypothetical protein
MKRLAGHGVWRLMSNNRDTIQHYPPIGLGAACLLEATDFDLAFVGLHEARETRDARVEHTPRQRQRQDVEGQTMTTIEAGSSNVEVKP